MTCTAIGQDGFDVVNDIGDITISDNTSAADNYGDGVCVELPLLSGREQYPGCRQPCRKQWVQRPGCWTWLRRLQMRGSGDVEVLSVAPDVNGFGAT